MASPRADVIIAVSPPLLLGPAAWTASLLHRSKYVFHVQDLQPDAAVGLGMLKPGRFTRLLYAIERFTYAHAWKVSGISDGMIAAFHAKGVPAERRLLFPNGVPFVEMPARGRFRERHGFSADDLLVVYSGNIGVKQSLEVLIDAAELILDPKVRIVICGDGARRSFIEERVREARNVRLLPLLNDAEYREMLADTDIAVITQQHGSGRAFFPSKLLNTLAASLPVVAVADEESELARAVLESGCGVAIAPEQPSELAQVIEALAGDPGRRSAFAKAGRHWVGRFEQQKLLAEFTGAITQGMDAGGD